MSNARLLAVMASALLVLVAAIAALVVWTLGGPGLAGLLADDAPLYAFAIVWVCLAPLPLALALLGTIRTPWPWVAVTAVHLVVTTAATARLRHLVPGTIWLGVAATIALGLVSAVAMTAQRSSTTAST